MSARIRCRGTTLWAWVNPPGITCFHAMFGRTWRCLRLLAARKVFNEGVIGPLTAPGEQAHNMSGGHGDYNRAVRNLWDDYLKETGIDPTKITKKES